MRPTSILGALLVATAGCAHPPARQAQKAELSGFVAATALRSSPEPTVFWGTLSSPGRFFLGRHTPGGLSDALTMLTTAGISSVTVEWQTHLNPSARKAVLDEFASYKVGIDRFSEPRDLGGLTEVSAKPTIRRSGAVTLLSDTLLRDQGCFVGVVAAQNPSDLARILAGTGIRVIRFESAFKLTDETVERFRRAFTSAGITLLSFWVPSSTLPAGAEDLQASSAHSP